MNFSSNFSEMITSKRALSSTARVRTRDLRLLHLCCRATKTKRGMQVLTRATRCRWSHQVRRHQMRDWGGDAHLSRPVPEGASHTSLQDRIPTGSLDHSGKHQEIGKAPPTQGRGPHNWRYGTSYIARVSCFFQCCNDIFLLVTETRVF